MEKPQLFRYVVGGQYHIVNGTYSDKTACGKPIPKEGGWRVSKVPYNGEVCDKCIEAARYCPMCECRIRQFLDHAPDCPQGP